MYELDQTDRDLLNLLQEGLTLTAEPYRDLADQLGGITQEELFRRVTRLREEGWIRRLSGFFQSSRLGYQSLLCAMRVPERHIEEMAGLILGIPAITHNYLRDHPLNMWFTVCCQSTDEVDRIIALLESSGWTDRIFRFERTKQFKIHARFDLREERK